MKTNLTWLLAAACAARVFAGVDPGQLAAARALYEERDKSAAARQAFEKIAAADPSCAEAHSFLVQLALRRNDAGQALLHAEKAVALAPGNIEFHQSLFDYYRNAPGIAGGGVDKAAAEAVTIRQLDANRGRLAFATLHMADKRYDLALAEFDEVLRTSPDDYAALYQVGKLAAVSGQHLDRGLAALGRCLELAPPGTSGTPGHAAAQWRRGNVLEKKNDPVGARAAYEAALKLDPQFTQAAEALKKVR